MPMNSGGSTTPSTATPPPPHIAVVVPTYNHGDRIAGVLDRAVPLGLPLIVVDDGSTDDTQDRLRRWQELHPRAPLTVRRHALNRGKAAALRTGFAAAAEQGATHAATIDADGQLDPADLPGLIAAATTAPAALVLGSRAEHIPGYPGRARFGRAMANLGIAVASGVRVRDSQCGLRIYPLGLVRAVRCSAARYDFETEIIVRAGWARCPVVEVPVACRYFPDQPTISRYRPWRDTFRGLALHARLILRALVPWPHARWPGDPVLLPPPRGRFRAWLNPLACWRELRAQNLGRAELAAGVGVGAFIAALPFYGFHTMLGLYAAWRLHLHPLAVVLGTQLSTPPLGLALVAASVGIGHLLLTGSLPAIEGIPAQLAAWTSAPWRLLLEWLVGGLIVGAVLAPVTFALVLACCQAAARRRLRRTHADPSGRPAEPA